MPLFSLPDQEGRMFNAKDIVGTKPLVLFFYPKNFTPGCTMEACSFRDKYEDFTAMGAEVIGISSDSEKSHQGFSAKFNLPFILLADSDNTVRKLFNVGSRFFNLLPGRETYVIDKMGKIVMVFNNVSAARHMPEALAAIKRLVKK